MKRLITIINLSLLLITSTAFGYDWMAPDRQVEANTVTAMWDNRNVDETADSWNFIIPDAHAPMWMNVDSIYFDEAINFERYQYDAEISQVLIDTQSVPVSAAIWLIGSAFLVIVGSKRN